MLTDSHAHLHRSEYDHDRSDCLKRAEEAGVTRVVEIALGPDPDTLIRAHDLVSGRAGMILAVGVHPHDAVRMTDATLPFLRSMARRPQVKAIGEIGLDYYYDHSPRDIQLLRFRELLHLALDQGLPVSIHSRDAFEDTYALLREAAVFERVGGVMHCFTGSAEEASRLLDLGAHVAFSGIITFKNAAGIREALAVVPMDRLLLETDSPFLSPEPYRGKRCEPAFVKLVAQRAAEIKGISLEETARQTTENALRLFRWQ